MLRSRLPGGVVVLGENRAGHGGRGIYVLGEHIEPEFAHLPEFLGPTGVFVDVGASTGIYALRAAKHFGAGGVVVALEPFPQTAATLYRSVQANGFDNVRVRVVCAGARTEARTLNLNRGRPNSFSLVEQVGDPPRMSVLTVALDDLLAWERLDRLDYLKVDAEGAEREILDGARKTLARLRPIVQVEVSVNYFTADLGDYTAFRAPGSHNVVYLPNEHDSFGVPEHLGWEKIPHG